MDKSLTNSYTAHFFRRSVHLLIGIVPIAYYCYGSILTQKISLNAAQFISVLVFLTIVFEVIRLTNQWKIFGQRDYETKCISAVAWTVFSVGLVLLQAPKIGVYGGALGIPLILSLCFADPLMGEARLKEESLRKVILVGVSTVSIVWLSCVFLLDTPWWIIPFIVPITVVSELLDLPWIDDNAVMLLLPLAMVLLFAPWM